MANPIPHKLIREVWERDEGLCQKCNRQGSSPPHHIVFGGTGRRRIHMIENLITLCRDCHAGAHSSKAIREWTYQWSRETYGTVVDGMLVEKWSGAK